MGCLQEHFRIQKYNIWWCNDCYIVQNHDEWQSVFDVPFKKYKLKDFDAEIHRILLYIYVYVCVQILLIMVVLNIRKIIINYENSDKSEVYIRSKSITKIWKILSKLL